MYIFFFILFKMRLIYTIKESDANTCGICEDGWMQVCVCVCDKVFMHEQQRDWVRYEKRDQLVVFCFLRWDDVMMVMHVRDQSCHWVEWELVMTTLVDQVNPYHIQKCMGPLLCAGVAVVAHCIATSIHKCTTNLDHHWYPPCKRPGFLLWNQYPLALTPLDPCMRCCRCVLNYQL